MDARKLVSKLVPASPRLPSGRRRVGKRSALKPAAALALEIFTQYREMRAPAPTRIYTPTQVRTSTGQEVTAATVSMAIGMLDQSLIFAPSNNERDRQLLRIGRDVFINSWWGDSAFRVDLNDLRMRVITWLVMPEYVAREERLFKASAEAARQAIALSISTRYGSKAASEAARSELQAATNERWPAMDHDRYQRMVTAVIHEMAGTSICPDCRGASHVFECETVPDGQAPRVGRLVPCPRCQGSGWVNATARSRARACKIDPSLYSRGNWKRLYGWLIRRLRALERDYRTRIGEVWD